MTASQAPSRRDLIRNTAVGLVLANIEGQSAWMSPAQATAASADYAVLNTAEAAWLSGLGEAIATPTRAAGLTHYVDHHLTLSATDSLLAVRYLDVPPPYAAFYRPALASLQRLYGAPPPSGDPRWSGVLAGLAGPVPANWEGPPPALFLFAVRLDAIDIAYGTRAGFARLGIEYLAHIEPETDW